MATAKSAADIKKPKKGGAYVKDYLRNAPDKFTLVDLFAGIGGFHYGVGAAARELGKGVETLLVSETEPTCREVYIRNHGGESVVEGDVTTIDENRLTSLAHTRADVLTAGFPCQPFSNSGKKLGLADPRGQFYSTIEKLIKKFKAKSFILENVPGIRTNGGDLRQSKLSHDPGQLIGKTMQILEEAMLTGLAKNYNIRWIEIDSSRLGSPQVRKRVYIIGLHKSLGPMPDLGSLADSGDRNSFRSVVDQLTPDDDEWDMLKLNPNQERNIRNDMRTRQISYTNGMRRVGNAYTCEGGNVGQAYHADGLVPTLTKVWARFLPIYFPAPSEKVPAGLDDRDFKPDTTYGRHGLLRRASLSEVMKLQGFPDKFEPYQGVGRKVSAAGFEHAGNAVNALVVRAIAHELLVRIDAA
jgi:DNA-cytosine methyltransferase